MNNVLSSVQMFEAGGNCDKYSKRFLYKNLVGGTATIGRERGKALEIEGVITRRTLVRRGYLIEQGAQNKESLFTSVTCLMRLPRRILRMLLVMTISISCRKAHKRRFLFNLIRRSLEKFFKKNFRDDSFTFGFAKILALALLLFLITTAESRANENGVTCKSDENYEMTCLNSLDYMGKDLNGNYICGNDCTFTIEGSTVKVKANSKNATISDGLFSSWSYPNGFMADGKNISFDKIELDGDFAYIGDFAFANSGAIVTTTNGILEAKSYGMKLFRGDVILDANVFIPSNEAASNQTFQSAQITGDMVFADGVTNVGVWFMGYANIGGNLVLPDSLTNITERNYLAGVDKIYCGGDLNDCYNMLYNSCWDAHLGVMDEWCVDELNSKKERDLLAPYPDGCTKMGATGCTKCKNENFKLNDGECDRLRWTPAEAAEVLTDDNNNSVTITFKK